MSGSPNTGRLVQSTPAPGKPGSLQALVLERGLAIAQYSLDPTTPLWKRDSVVSKKSNASACLIQSKYGATLSNFEAVVVEDRNLVHYSRDNSVPSSTWERKAVISKKCLGPASLIQAQAIGNPMDNPGNFEVVVWEEGNQLVLYTRDNSKPNPTWTSNGAVISTSATGPASLIQNSFVPRASASGATGNYELVFLENNNLVHYYRDNQKTDTPWFKNNQSPIISSEATTNGPGSIIQSTFGTPGNGNLELVVLELNRNLVLYYCDSATRKWKKSVNPITSSSKATGPGSIIQRTDVIPPRFGDFEVIVIEDSSTLAHYSRDNSDTQRRWIRRQNVSGSAIG
jgi:hypothetical protein